MSLGDGLKFLFGTADDVYLGSVDGKGLDGHQADSASWLAVSIAFGRRWDMLTSTSDKSNFAFDIEEVTELEVVIISLHFPG